ncbi:GAF domain-containing hybrid sensor histidine kinase/response regulator [Acaryochloris sp. CCMEE 5410]|uniref:hybrid sensor histidine kinase/response regulator n=1 Tax=Acaryochloris sp. CCMEE 5410 TaxID=310037 RepID=UPI00024850BD|nr:GAF domain-containing hybrid sensor histidine kinase/response regulator [Acaryochloris sp. CCMEE 5410]KAI9132191.1 response regulator [Acaryochloris sp. CCMEE 5410]
MTPDRTLHLLEVLTSLSYRQSDLNAYLTTVVSGISQLIGTDWSIVTLCQGEQYQILASSVEMDNAETVWNLHGSITNCVVEQGATLMVEDSAHDPIGQMPAGYAAYLGIPIKTPMGKVLGTVCSFYRQPHRCTEEEVQFAEVLAERAAIAIDNYQLYQRQQLVNAQYQQLSEQLVIVNAALKRAAGLKDEFLSTMSHELRTPLTAIIGLAEVLREEVYGSLNPKQLKSVCTIEESGETLLAQLNDLIDLSKIESGNLVLERGRVSMGALVESCLAIVRPQALEQNITLSHHIPSDLAEVTGDELRLRQVLQNLISNALKFTPQDGEVSVQATADAEQVQVSVTDTGIGITPAELSNIFEPFVQLDSSWARPYSGTGLGLTLVQRLVNLHGGTVKVESEVGRGSTFTVTLPCSQFPPEKAEPTDLPHQPQNISEPLILLAEDREAIVLLLTDYLEEQGYRVAIATDGQTAIDLATTQIPDLIFMDIRLPQMDGLEATRQIRNHLPDTPIIALTALLMPEDQERFLAAGFSDSLSKPLKMEQLTQMLTKHLQI